MRGTNDRLGGPPWRTALGSAGPRAALELKAGYVAGGAFLWRDLLEELAVLLGPACPRPASSVWVSPARGDRRKPARPVARQGRPRHTRGRPPGPPASAIRDQRSGRLPAPGMSLLS